MNEVLSPPGPRKNRKWLLVAACLLLIAGGGWLYFSLTATGDGTFYSIVTPGGTVSGPFGPIPVEVALELAQDGLTAKYLATSAAVEQNLFVRKERYGVKIHLTAGKKEVDKDGLFYTILGAKDEKLSEGKVSLESTLKPGQSGDGEITNLQIPNGRRIVIH
jgi:hypothetical protein